MEFAEEEIEAARQAVWLELGTYQETSVRLQCRLTQAEGELREAAELLEWSDTSKRFSPNFHFRRKRFINEHRLSRNRGEGGGE